MSLRELAEIDLKPFELLSADLFDTVLLRDLSLQNERFSEISSHVATALKQRGRNVDARSLTSMRLALHGLAYRAVSIERPEGDVRLGDMQALQARLLGDADLVALLREAELSVERRRLTANRPLLTLLGRFAAAGKRIVAVSDTYYSTRELEQLLAWVVGEHPFARVYSSSDLGLTKHAGAIFADVARRENVATARILHFGDNLHADVAMARAAGCQAVHLSRPAATRIAHTAHGLLFHTLHPRMAG